MLTPEEKMQAEKVTEEFWKEIEAEAAKYEVTVDYYLAEFYCSWLGIFSLRFLVWLLQQRMQIGYPKKMVQFSKLWRNVLKSVESWSANSLHIILIVLDFLFIFD